MTATEVSKAQRVRAKLNHPVIDADGHTVELKPMVVDYVRRVGGGEIAERYLHEDLGTLRSARWQSLQPGERKELWDSYPAHWGLPARNTLDRATGSLPRLMYERMDEVGLDFAIVYPTQGLMVPDLRDEELRTVTCRALNMYHADLFREYSDRMTPAAVIPMYSPKEAIDELEYAVGTLGFKTVMMASYARRPVPRVYRDHPELEYVADRLDTFGLDSEYDYDPVWAKCVELGVVPGAHSVGFGWGSRRSISNYTYNHIGHFAAAGEALCKSLFMGGVTRRFPQFKMAILEGGAAWACSLWSDLVGHWEKRGAKNIQHINPANIDRELLTKLMSEYGGAEIVARLDQVVDSMTRPSTPLHEDEFHLCQIEKVEDMKELFESHFYIGCEADDPMNALAFNTALNPLGMRLRAIFSSDIGHYDVPDMTEVLEEAYELVEKGLLTSEDFRDFTFANVAGLYTSLNPDFFSGTRCEESVARLLESPRK